MYFENPKINAVFTDFIENRKEMKKKPTERAINQNKKNVEKLIASIGEEDTIESIKQSIERGYLGIFPIKKTATFKKEKEIKHYETKEGRNNFCFSLEKEHTPMGKFDFKNYDFKRSLLFAGPTGVFKTYYAEKLVEKFKKTREEKSNLDTYTVTDGHLKQLIKSNALVLRKPEDWASDIKNYPLEMMRRCKLLLIDDLGVSDNTDAYIRDLTYILDERIKKNLKTIFTTNSSLEELKKHLNERIVSRILYNTDVVIFSGEDRRVQTTNFYTKD